MKNDFDAGRIARTWGMAPDLSLLSERDHVCWAYEDRASFVENAIEFLREGLWRGMRVVYVGALPLAELIEEIRPLGDVDALMFQRRLRVATLLDLYPEGSIIDQAKQLASTRRGTREATRDGYSGYRVASDSTSLVRTAAQRDAFTRFEHLCDRMMTNEPFSAMCGYDEVLLGPEAVMELECVHPVAQRDSSFHLFARSGASIALAGEIDVASRDLFVWALTRLGPSDRKVNLDISGLGFIDHRGLLALEENARRNRRVVTLRGGDRIVSTLASLLRLDHVRTEEVA